MSILSQYKQSQNTDFPNIRPSLDLRFALAKKLDPRITFTRGSTGTYFGSDGLMRTAGVNEPRFDHDPVTGQSLGLLIEESRTNLLTYSEDFTNAVWGSAQNRATRITQTGVDDPRGGFTAATYKNGGRTNLELVYRLVSGTIGIPYTYSVWLRRRVGNGTIQLIVGDLVYQTVNVTNQWARFSVTNTPTTTNVRAYISINGIGDEVDVWGAQLETGAFPTSYIPTSASTVTRSADNASMTGTNFSSWYNSSEGTIYLETDKLYAGNFDAYRHFYGLDDGQSSPTSSISPYTLPGLTFITNYGIVNGGRQVFDYQQFNIGSSPIRYKIGHSLNSKYSFFKTSTASSTPQLPSKASPNGQNLSLPTNMTQLTIGCQNNSGTFGKHINSHIARFTYYPIQITNQQLINLTS